MFSSRSVRYLFYWFMFFSLVAEAQEKKPLSHDVYDSWTQLENYGISNNGKFVLYELNPQKGDGTLFIKALDNHLFDSVSRGTKATFSPSSNFIIYTISASYDTIRSAKLKKVKKEKLPKDSLGISVLETARAYRFANLKSFQVPEDTSDWVAILTEMEVAKASKDTAAIDSLRPVVKPKKKKGKTNSNRLVLLNPISGDSAVFDRVEHYKLSDNGHLCAIVQHFSDSIDSVRIIAYQPELKKTRELFFNAGASSGVTVDKTGSQLAFTYSADTVKEKSYTLYYVNLAEENSILVPGGDFSRLKDGWSVSEYKQPWFNEHGDELYFGAAPMPEIPVKDTLTEDEKVSVDIWNWKDDRLQPQQLKMLDSDKKKSYTAVYFPKTDKVLQLATPAIPSVHIDNSSTKPYVLGYDYQPYKWSSSWDNNGYKDVYLINRKTGEVVEIIKNASSVVSLDPSQKSVVWYSRSDSSWYAYLINKNQIVNLTGTLDIAFFYEKNDVPNTANSYGIAGWTDEGRCVVYDSYDLWLLDPLGKKSPFCLTKQVGRENKTQFRYVRLDPNKRTLSGDLLLSVFDTKTKEAGFAMINLIGEMPLDVLIKEPCSFSRPLKAKIANQLIWRKESFENYPDLYTSSQNFTQVERLTDANPNHNNYAWGTVSLVDWMTFEGDSVQGLLYFPANYDPQQKYPMLVYFYERYSDDLHRYYIPKPIRSVINFSYYASNGYFIFIPDIAYNDGFPGQSAYDYVISGTQAMLSKYPAIDRDKLGIQGQSWGGYQTAWLITRTNMFAAAMAGAPVSNMTSAYGGIRWQTGLSRAFQYEQGQSRIGATLWENRDLYIENSPLFFADRVNTPLLIMHNDADGAVPWYQGIEFFSALRRLGKPVWMLVYNGAPHNLKRRADCEDLTVRMQQFFDFYLKDAPEPVWMKEGVPALEKGRSFGFELVD